MTVLLVAMSGKVGDSANIEACFLLELQLSCLEHYQVGINIIYNVRATDLVVMDVTNRL